MQVIPLSKVNNIFIKILLNIFLCISFHKILIKFYIILFGYIDPFTTKLGPSYLSIYVIVKKYFAVLLFVS